MRLGSLCSGYGGLDLAVEEAFGAETCWVADNEKGPSRILGERFPGVPNLGDITAVDWPAAPPIDVLSGGTPCQDLSHAGKRAGMTEGTRSNLWVAMREAIAALRPSYVVWENVRGAYSAEADSEVVVGGRLLAPLNGGYPLRALGRVLGDLSDLGYNACWRGLRAADVGAPHGRFRVFVIARRADSPPAVRGRGRTRVLGLGPKDLTLLPTPVVNDMGARKTPEEWDAWTTAMRAKHANGNGHGPSLEIEALRLLPTPDANVGQYQITGDTQRSKSLEAMARRGELLLLPTPSAANADGGQTSRSGDRSDELLLGGIVKLLPTPVTEPDTGNGHARNLRKEAQRLLPTPTVSDHPDGRRSTIDGETYSADGYVRNQLGDLAAQNLWGEYEGAIRRWETVFGRPAPEPTLADGRDGARRLSARFVEWMMGLPEGWVTGVEIPRNDALRALGNGVVPQQAAAAIEYALDAFDLVDDEAAAS